MCDTTSNSITFDYDFTWSESEDEVHVKSFLRRMSLDEMGEWADFTVHLFDCKIHRSFDT